MAEHLSGHNGHSPNGHTEPILDSPGETRPDDDPVVVAGRVAWNRHKETQRKQFISDWLPIGAALVIGRAWAVRGSGADVSRKDHRYGSAYYKVFGQWLTVNGFADIHDAVQKALFDIMDHLDAVLAWRSKLDEAQQREWNSPTTVWRHYQESLEPQPEPKPEPKPETQPAAAVDTAADTVTQEAKPAAPAKEAASSVEPEPDADTNTDDDTDPLIQEAAQALLRSLGEEKCRELLDALGDPEGVEDWYLIGRELVYLLDNPDETAEPEPDYLDGLAVGYYEGALTQQLHPQSTPIERLAKRFPGRDVTQMVADLSGTVEGVIEVSLQKGRTPASIAKSLGLSVKQVRQVIERIERLRGRAVDKPEPESSAHQDDADEEPVTPKRVTPPWAKTGKVEERAALLLQAIEAAGWKGLHKYEDINPLHMSDAANDRVIDALVRLTTHTGYPWEESEAPVIEVDKRVYLRRFAPLKRPTA